jgi:hypothetical protein
MKEMLKTSINFMNVCEYFVKILNFLWLHFLNQIYFQMKGSVLLELETKTSV